MSATQLSFSLRLSAGVKTVHLLGSWDGYQGQLPLAKDKSAKSGTWKGTFRFQSSTLEAGNRYWYYYIIDGYHVAHNPSEANTVEATTGRALNILDVPRKSSSSSSKSSSRSSKSSSSSSSKRSSDIPKGRPLSVSQIKAPKPVSPNATKNILNEEYDVETLASRFADASFEDYECASPVSSVGSDLSYRSGSSSPASDMSGYSSPASDCSTCTCERYGITRRGERVHLDCGGSRCGDESSDCSSDEEECYSATSSRRHGMLVRA